MNKGYVVTDEIVKCGYKNCDNTFHRLIGFQEKKYCSRKCKQNASKILKRHRKSFIYKERVCKQCGINYKRAGVGKFCTIKCQKESTFFEYQIRQKASLKFKPYNLYLQSFNQLNKVLVKCASCGTSSVNKRLKYCKKCATIASNKYKKKYIDHYYRSKEWIQIRKDFYSVASNNICFECLSKGILTNGNHLDHIKPRRLGGSNDVSNLQPLCKRHHAVKSAKEGNERYNIPKLGNNTTFLDFASLVFSNAYRRVA